jgi:hypothetical protein
VKKSIFLTLLSIQLSMVQGQSSQDRVLLSADKGLFYIELNGDQGTVFNLGRWIDKGGSGYSIIYTDSITKQPETSDFLFAGDKATIQQADNKLYLVAQGRKSGRKMEIDTITDPGSVNTRINNAYWWSNFFRLCGDIDSVFRMYHYSFRTGFVLWNSFDNKEIYYKDFKVYADNKLKMIRDSIVAVQTPYLLLTDELIANMATIGYDSLKEKLVKLTTGDMHGTVYFGSVVNSVCNNRPELFFKLAEDMQDKKTMLFDAVSDRKTIKKLTALPSDSPAKKEFLKAKKKDRAFTAKMIGNAAAGAVLLGACIYFLVR